MSTRDYAALDQIIASVFDRIPARDVRLARTAHAFGGTVEPTGWTATARVERMGKRGQRLGRGVEELSGDGESPEEAVDKLVQFYEWRRAGLV
jgi:hypothetical protein